MSTRPLALKRTLIGRPRASGEMNETLLSKRLALPIFASDPLSSVAYATEAALVVLVYVARFTRFLGTGAELHAALSSDPTDSAFAPERTSALDHRSIYQSISGLSMRAIDLLRTQLNRLPADAKDDARKVLELDARIASMLKAFLARRLNASRIRVHGDYHLGQVLYTGHDFVIIDFEGEPTRSLYERRLKRLAMRDVAGMLRSFSYASQAALRSQEVPAERLPELQTWARFWVDSVSAVFLRSYLATAGSSPWVTQNQDDLELQLNTMLLEKALYEIAYELNNRPDWVRIPIRGALDLLI